MCKFKLFSIAAAALMMVACSNEDLTQQTQTKAGKMQFSATIAAPNKGGTRTVYTEDTQNNKITVAWEVDDEIALVHDGVKDVATVKTINSDGSATITGYVTGATNNADVRLVYPAARVGTVTGGADGTEYTADETVEGKLKTQGGTLAYIQDNLDFREDMGQLAVSETGVTLAEKAGDIKPLLAIWKLTLSDGTNNLSATQVKIKGGESVLASTTTLTAGTSVVTLAIPTDVFIDGALTIEATVGDDTYAYTKAEGATFNPGTYYQSTVTMAPAATDLSKLTGDYTAKNGETLTGTLAGNYKISIADGATVTLDGVTITGENNSDYKWAGITCEGDATIILKDGSENTVKGFYERYPGIYVPDDAENPANNKTLTIKGTGSLTASSNGNGAGIGGGKYTNCGNIEIQGGVITATGSSYAAGIGGAGESSCGFITISGGTVTATGGNEGAGIGSGYYGTCGDILISGGTIEATGGAYAAAIGSGDEGSCGNITITTGVTQVTATKGAGANNSIGAGNDGTCGTVTIGGTVYWDGSAYQNGGDTYLTQSTIVYPSPFANVTASDLGKVIGADGKIYADATAATTAGTTAVAMIAYVGSGSDCTHGLAIALEKASSKTLSWDNSGTNNDSKTAAEWCSAWNTSKPVTGGTWRLPSKADWQNMFVACAVSGDASAGDTMNPITGYMNKIKAAAPTPKWIGLSNVFWTSTEDSSDKAWYVSVNLSQGEAVFHDSNKNSATKYVLCCLAF